MALPQNPLREGEVFLTLTMIVGKVKGGWTTNLSVAESQCLKCSHLKSKIVMVKTQSSLPNFTMIFVNDWLGVIAVAKRTRRSHERHIAKEHLPYPQSKRFFFTLWSLLLSNSTSPTWSKFCIIGIVILTMVAWQKASRWTGFVFKKALIFCLHTVSCPQVTTPPSQSVGHSFLTLLRGAHLGCEAVTFHHGLYLTSYEFSISESLSSYALFWGIVSPKCFPVALGDDLYVWKWGVYHRHWCVALNSISEAICIVPNSLEI